MAYDQWIELFAHIVIIDILILVLIDVGAELKIWFALRMKWSILWYLLRYIAQGCAIALAISVVRA